MLFTAKENDDMKALAEKLELLLLKSWQREEKSVVDVYKLLNLDKEGDQLFKNPLADTLLKYATMTDKKNPFDGVLSMFQTRYNDEALTDMLIGMMYWGPRNILTDQPEELLLKNWQHDGKTIMDVFRQLKLDKPGSALFENPVLATWVSYVAKLENNPYDVVFSILKSGYGEKALASMIVAARYNPRTKTLAKTLKNIQLSSWENADYTLGHAFNLLKLNAQGEEVFGSLVLSTWISYANKIDEAKADEAVLTVLKQQFGDIDLARMMAKAKVQSTLDVGEDAKIVLERLQKLQFKKWMARGTDIKKLESEIHDSAYTKVIEDFTAYYKANAVRV